MNSEIESDKPGQLIAAAAIIRSYLELKQPSIPATVLILGCRSAKMLSLLQSAIPRSKITAFIEDDSDYLLAERLLKDSPDIQVLDSRATGVFLKRKRRFDVILRALPIGDRESLTAFLKYLQFLLSKDGIALLIKNPELAEDDLSHTAAHFNFEETDHDNCITELRPTVSSEGL